MKCPICNKDTANEKWCEFCGAPLNENYRGANRQNVTHTDEDFSNETEYINIEESILDYNQPLKTANKGLKIALAILIPLAVAALIVVILVMSGAFKSDSHDNKSDKSASDLGANRVSSGEILENEELDTLVKNGEYYIGMGDYDSAETIYKTIIDKYSGSNEAQLLYNILYNYNRALKKLETKKFEDAREIFDKIPGDYVYYDSLKETVEDLDDEIIMYEVANSTFENLEEYIKDGDYEGASEVIDLINESYLSEEQIKALDRYREDVDEALKRNAKDEKESDADTQGQITLEPQDAENLIRDYLNAYVKAINENDFGIVAPYISGDLYRSQKDQVTTRSAEGQREEFNFVTLLDLRSLDSEKWEADVNESLTVIYPNGTEEIFEKYFTYTVEYKDGIYYLIDVRKTNNT